jgi:puromycin-sensitive aminopeptidase
MVLKVGTDAGVREERVLLTDAEARVRVDGARWVFPNGGGAGFYRYALDDAALACLAGAVGNLAPEERLNLVGNQWALVKAGVADVGQFVTLLEAFRDETDRAVLDAIVERLVWVDTHALEEAARPAFARLVTALFQPQLTALGWDPAGADERADVRMKRATVLGALGRLARDAAVRGTARTRLDRYLVDQSGLEPNLVSTVAHVVAGEGDASLYDRYLARKRAGAVDDPEEEERFLLALAAFEDPRLVARTLALTFTDEVRPQDRAFVVARLLGNRAARLDTWAYLRAHWAEHVATMDPMLRQYVIRGMAQLTPAAVAGEVGTFLAHEATDETRETTAQACEALRIDAAAVARIAPALTAALTQRVA